MNGMIQSLKVLSIMALSAGLGLLGTATPPASAVDKSTDANESAQSVDKLAALSYVTWWSHDATGYHPAILLKMENYSGKDLTAQLMKFQARFVDLASGVTTLGRREVRQAFVPHQQIYVLLKGKQDFELSIDENEWPAIECKVMCRIGEVGDSGTQTLVVAKLERITMSDEDAMQKMGRMSDFRSYPQSSSSARQIGKSNQPSHTKPEVPLSARAGKLPGTTQPAVAKPTTDSVLSFITAKGMPGLGDDFYLFEKAFGLPEQTNSSNQQGWSWASYKHTQPRMTVLAGSHGLSGKVDIIIIKLPEPEIKHDQDLLAVSKALAGALKNQKLTAPSHSVRYLPAGRVQLLTCCTPGYHCAYFTAAKTTPDGSSAFIVLSRATGDIVDLLLDHGKHATLVQPVADILSGKNEQL